MGSRALLKYLDKDSLALASTLLVWVVVRKRVWSTDDRYSLITSSIHCRSCSETSAREITELRGTEGKKIKIKVQFHITIHVHLLLKTQSFFELRKNSGLNLTTVCFKNLLCPHLLPSCANAACSSTICSHWEVTKCTGFKQTCMDKMSGNIRKHAKSTDKCESCYFYCIRIVFKTLWDYKKNNFLLYNKIPLIVRNTHSFSN